MPSVLLASDLDCTLLDNDSRIPAECLGAIRAFTEAGGLFTVVTGRPTRGVHRYPELISHINAPMISYNGGCISDAQSRRILWQTYLPEGLSPIIRSALDRFPAVGALVFRGEDDYTTVTQPNEYTHEVTWNREGYRTPQLPLEEAPYPWNKVVMAGNPDDMEKCTQFIQECAGNMVSMVLTERVFLEINAAGVQKGDTLDRVAKMLNVSQQHVLAIGDSMNDIQMLRYAGVSAVVANAQPEAAAIADIIVPSNAEHGIVTFIEKVAMPMLRKK